jgi:hypothetical protein
VNRGVGHEQLKENRNMGPFGARRAIPQQLEPPNVCYRNGHTGGLAAAADRLRRPSLLGILIRVAALLGVRSSVYWLTPVQPITVYAQ